MALRLTRAIVGVGKQFTHVRPSVLLSCRRSSWRFTPRREYGLLAITASDGTLIADFYYSHYCVTNKRTPIKAAVAAVNAALRSYLISNF